MTLAQRYGFGYVPPRIPAAEGVEAYQARPSVLCDECHAEFSEPVGRLHAQRTGHSVGTVPAWLLEETRARQREAEVLQGAYRACTAERAA